MSGSKLKEKYEDLTSNDEDDDEGLDTAKGNGADKLNASKTVGNVSFSTLKLEEPTSDLSSDSENDTSLFVKKLCPFGRVNSDALLEASYDSWSTMQNARKLVVDAVSGWDTRAIIGAFHNELAIPQTPKDNQAKVHGSKSAPKLTNNRKQSARPLTCSGGVRWAYTQLVVSIIAFPNVLTGPQLKLKFLVTLIIFPNFLWSP